MSTTEHSLTAEARPTPWWIWALIVGLALIEPLTHVWIAHFPPDQTVPTGMHINDSPYFLQPMRMFLNDFHSPYATAKSPWGANSPRFFSLPDNYLYGALGGLATLLHIDHFLFLGIANGLGLLLYLWIVYRFLREIVPQYANWAFLLFCLGAGPGGPLYFLTSAAGLHGLSTFDMFFQRYVWYELIEEGNLWPVHQMVRLYKTFPLALFFLSLTWFIRAHRTANNRLLWAALPPMAAATFFNVVYGPLIWGLALFYLYARTADPIAQRIKNAILLAIPVFLGALAASAIVRMNPAALQNALAIRRAMWFSPFISAIALHLIPMPVGIAANIRRLPPWGRIAAHAAIGYLIAFTFLYGAYQVYYGNLFFCLDYSAALRISDPALIGALAGALFAWFTRPARCLQESVGERGGAWITLWLLIFMAAALSAFGQGWFLRFAPKRLMYLMGLPICIHSAIGLRRIAAAWPRYTLAYRALFIVCGICSTAAACLFFQGPLGRQAGEGPFAYLHAEIMSPDEARALDELGPGTVLTSAPAPPYIGDVIALRPQNSVVFAQGTLNFSDQPIEALGKAVGQFFDPKTGNSFRRAFLAEWRVDYVYCPDNHPVDKDTLAALRAAPWLREQAAHGRAVIFEVDLEEGKER